jgi:hypothetical protein
MQLSMDTDEHPDGQRQYGRGPHPVEYLVHRGAKPHQETVNRTESTANIAQPRANPHRTAPVTALSSAEMNGATARSRAATSPLANEPATTQPICPLGPRSGWDGRPQPLSLGVGSVATMDSIPCTVRRRTCGTCRQRDTRRQSPILS